MEKKIVEEKMLRLLEEFETEERSLIARTKNCNDPQELKTSLEKAILILDRLREELIGGKIVTICEGKRRERIKQVRAKNTFTDKFIRELIKIMKGKKLFENEEEIDDDYDYGYWHRALSSEGTCDYVDNNFFRRRDKVGALILGQEVDENIKFKFSLVQETFSLGLFPVTVILLRALLEDGLFFYLKRTGHFPGNISIINFESWKASEMLKLIKPKIGKEFSAAQRIIHVANSILHGKKEVGNVDEEYTIKGIETTLRILEELYK